MRDRSPAPLLLCAILLAASSPPGGRPAGLEETALPARFAAGRIFLDLPLRGGQVLVLYTDTGGGLFLLGAAAERIGADDPGGVLLSELVEGLSFPDPLGAADRRLPVFTPQERRDHGYDGMLGQAWFADRVWTFDYPAARLLLHDEAPPAQPGASAVPLGFRTDASGARVLSFPRVRAEVDGEVLEMLFDTGATLDLTPSAHRTLADALPAARATSFVTSEVLEGWHRRHPDWRVIPDADANVPDMRVIEVPEVTIAGHTVGPVWFTERPDANFHEYMSQWMDRRVDGAVGGNVLGHFRVTVDYPAATAWFVPG